MPTTRVLSACALLACGAIVPAIGPATGALAGLRLALRSTHVYRKSDLANEYGGSGGSRFRRDDYRWQWQPEVSLGYQLPVLGRSAMAR